MVELCSFDLLAVYDCLIYDGLTLWSSQKQILEDDPHKSMSLFRNRLSLKLQLCFFMSDILNSLFIKAAIETLIKVSSDSVVTVIWHVTVLSVTEIRNCGRQTQAKINNELVLLISINVVSTFIRLAVIIRTNSKAKRYSPKIVLVN